MTLISFPGSISVRKGRGTIRLRGVATCAGRSLGVTLISFPGSISVRKGRGTIKGV